MYVVDDGTVILDKNLVVLCQDRSQGRVGV